MDEELEPIIGRSIVLPQRHRSWKTAAALGVAVGAALLVVAFVVQGRASARQKPESTASVALEDGVAMKVLTMKVRKRSDQCTEVKGDCTATHCCQGTNIYCWKTNTGGGKCQEKSEANWPGEELEGPDTIVPVDSQNMGSSLFCFSVYRKDTGTHDMDDMALDLLRTQKRKNVGIFTCDMWRVYSDANEYLDDYKVIQVWGDDFHQARRPEKGGWGGNQWINTPLYRKVWGKIYEEFPHGFYSMTWTIKADPDTLFLPDRLRARLKNQPVPQTGVYIEHCKSVNYGFFGSLEVMSRTAAKILFENVERCYNWELPWKSDEITKKFGWYGEDLFAQRCMDYHGVKKIWQFDLVTDGTCKLGRPWGKEHMKKWTPDPVSCAERDNFVAFKPLKDPKDFFACISSLNDGKRYDV